MTNKDPGILFACALDGKGGGRTLEGKAISETVKSKALAWVHLNGNNHDARKWLEKEIAYLDDIILDALLTEDARPRIVEFEEGVLLIMRGVNLNENAEPEDMVSVRLWVDPYRIISVQRRGVKAVLDIHGRLSEGKGPTNAADFLVSLVALLFARMEPVMDALDEQTDSVEEKVMEEPDASERAEIIDIRKQAILLRRYIAPQRDAIAQLRTSELSWLEPLHRRRLQESLDRITRYVEELDTIRERAQIVKDELTNALSDRLNKNLYLLSVVAAIFLPLGFLTGLLGINVGGMPGADNPHAFWIFTGMLVVVVALQMAVFKKLKWI